MPGAGTYFGSALGGGGRRGHARKLFCYSVVGVQCSKVGKLEVCNLDVADSFTWGEGVGVWNVNHL